MLITAKLQMENFNKYLFYKKISRFSPEQWVEKKNCGLNKKIKKHDIKIKLAALYYNNC